jgi:hypothetical protein
VTSDSPKLTLFEMQVCPSELRLAITGGQPLVFGYKHEASAKPSSLSLMYAGNEALFAELLESLDWLVLANNILGTPQNQPEHAFEPEYMNSHSLHLRLVYGDGQKYSTLHLMDALPPNVRALLDQVLYLGQTELEQRAAPQRPAQPAAMPTPPQPVPANDTRPVVKVRIRATGELEVDGTALRPMFLLEELRDLKDEAASVWYYVESGADVSQRAVRDAISFVEEAARTVGLTATRVDQDRP